MCRVPLSLKTSYSGFRYLPTYLGTVISSEIIGEHDDL
jgi:hypothetical protein